MTVVVQNDSVVYVAGIAMKVSSGRKGYQATASVTVRNQNGQAVRGATVTGTWSGLTSGTASKSTGRTGVAAISSSRSKSRGTFVFTVTGIALSGYTYDPDRNTETSDSIATP